MVPMINNGASSISGNVTVGGSVTFSCSMGFIINGTATVTCLISESFHHRHLAASQVSQQSELSSVYTFLKFKSGENINLLCIF